MRLNIENCAKNGEPGHKEWALEELVRNLKEVRDRSNAGDMHAAVTEFFEVFRFNDGVGVAALAAQPGADDRENIEAVIACLGDDAAQLRDSNPEDERADNMDRAAELLGRLLADATTPTEAKPAQDAVDAERWRWAMSNWTTFMKLALRADDLAVAIDHAISASKEQP